MKRRNSHTAIVATSILFLFIQVANSAITITAYESGSNVVFFASGSINIAALESLEEPGFTCPVGILNDYMNPSTATIVFPDPGIDPQDARGEFCYTATVSGPSSFGTGSPIPASNASGDSFGWFFSGSPGGAALHLPSGYISNSPLSSTMTFENQSLFSLGIAEGSYTWSWSSGSNSDSATLNITTIPEPSSVLLLGLLAMPVVFRRRRY